LLLLQIKIVICEILLAKAKWSTLLLNVSLIFEACTRAVNLFQLKKLKFNFDFN
jgi:hypothetical protein